MKYYKFDMVKEERKALVAAMSEITGYKPTYKGAPSFEYAVGDYSVDRNGTIIAYDVYDEDELAHMVSELSKRGYNYEDEESKPDSAEYSHEGHSDEHSLEENIPASADDDIMKETPDNTEGKLSLEISVKGFSTTALNNLQNIVHAKSWVIKLMTGADVLPIENIEDRLIFPWFKAESSPEEINAYSHLLTRLCETAKTKKRVSGDERIPNEGDNLKYKGRCFLLSLGFIGPEFSQVRKVLLKNLPGNGSFLRGERKKETITNTEAKTETTENISNTTEAQHERTGTG